MIFSSTGRRQAGLCYGPVSSCVRQTVRASTFTSNTMFSETTHPILMKFHRNDPAIVLFKTPWNNLMSSKALVTMAKKLKNVGYV